jgi:hypothetical protein
MTQNDTVDIGGELYYLGTANTQRIRANNNALRIKSRNVFEEIYGSEPDVAELCIRYLFFNRPTYKSKSNSNSDSDIVVTRTDGEKTRLIAILRKGLHYFNNLIQSHDNLANSKSKSKSYSETLPPIKIYNNIKKIILYMKSEKKGATDMSNTDIQKILVYFAWFLLHREETDKIPNEFTQQFDTVVDSIKNISLDHIVEGLKKITNKDSITQHMQPFDYMERTDKYDTAMTKVTPIVLQASPLFAPITKGGGDPIKNDIEELLRLLYFRSHIDTDINLKHTMTDLDSDSDSDEEKETCMYMDESLKQNMMPIFQYFSDTDPLYAEMEEIVWSVMSQSSCANFCILKQLQILLSVCNSGKQFYKITNANPSIITFISALITEKKYSVPKKQYHIFIDDDIFMYYGDIHKLSHVKTVIPIDYDEIELDGSFPKRQSHKRKSQSYSYKNIGYISHHELAMSILALSKYLMTN